MSNEYQDTSAQTSSSGDIPVNPYSLLEAVNQASGAARGGWVLFLGLMTYVLIAVAGVTHQDLLLNSKVALPVLQVAIELTRFFLFAPIVLLFVHFGLLIQHVMLSRKTLEFDRALRPLEATTRRTHPLRLELHSYFFTQALAGPHRGWLLGSFLHAMIWLTLVSLPVIIILFTQVVFLPYHDVFTTSAHRLVLLADTFILLAMGVFLRRPEASFFGAFWRTARHHPINFIMTGMMLSVVILFSFLVATIPDEPLDRLTRNMPGYSVNLGSTDDGGIGRVAFGITALLFEGGAGSGEKNLTELFRRNLIVQDKDLVLDRDDSTGEVSLNLRDRDLRYANLDRSDLHRADLTGSDLTGASLVGTDLRNARLSCADITAVLTLEKKREDSCTRMISANLTRANLSGADLQLSFLNGSKFEAASLIATDLRYTNLLGADFSGADMQRADVSGGADVTGANFLGAILQGADFSGAKLYGADFSSAALHGAIFTLAQAQGVNFQGAELDGASFTFSKLQGADFSAATLKGTDLTSATIWMTPPPESEDAKLANLSQLKIAPLSENEIKALTKVLHEISDPAVKKRITATIGQLYNRAETLKWQKSEAMQTWRLLKQLHTPINSSTYANDLTNYLMHLSCQVRWSDGSVASGIIQRALSPSFKGQIGAINTRLQDPACPASSALPEDLIQRLSSAVERQVQSTPPAVVPEQ